MCAVSSGRSLGVRSTLRSATTSSSRPASLYRLLTPFNTTTSRPRTFIGRKGPERLLRLRELARPSGAAAGWWELASEEEEESRPLSAPLLLAPFEYADAVGEDSRKNASEGAVTLVGEGGLSSMVRSSSSRREARALMLTAAAQADEAGVERQRRRVRERRAAEGEQGKRDRLESAAK